MALIDQDDIHTRETFVPPPPAVTVPAPAPQKPFDAAYAAHLDAQEAFRNGLTAVNLEPISDESLLTDAKAARANAKTLVDVKPITDADLLAGLDTSNPSRYP